MCARGCTQSRRTPGTSQTASPSSRATWRVHRSQRVQVVVLRTDGYQVLLRQRHLRHGRPGEYVGVREYTLLYSVQTDTRYSRQRHLRHRQPAEYTRVREYKWLYSEQTDTRYFSDSVTFVTGDLQSTEGSESTHCCTRSRRIPGTSQTVSPSYGRSRECTGVREYMWLYSEQTDTSLLLRQRHLRHRRPGEYRGVREYTLLYSEQTDTRYFTDSVTFVTGDLESTEGSESTHCCTQSRQIPGTSQTASPSSWATWRVHKGQKVHMVVLRANGYQLTSQTVSPSLRATWRVHTGQRVRYRYNSDCFVP
jgi:hypothetical protein